MDNTWTTRRILTELCSPEQRQDIAACFWRHATPEARRNAVPILANAIRFRAQKVKDAPPSKKAAWTVSRLHDPELVTLWTEALAVFHLTERRPLMAACLGAWGVPNEDGIVEVEEYPFPEPAALEATIPALTEQFPARDLAIYLATAGLVMGHDDPRWREATWPIVGTLAGG
ncbi:MAG: hypothetical protein KDA22_05615 [Phycisphaerales bacterium]|nr:hypothetical protein [Phycisphaerales bacterium]